MLNSGRMFAVQKAKEIYSIRIFDSAPTSQLLLLRTEGKVSRQGLLEGDAKAGVPLGKELLYWAVHALWSFSFGM